MSSTSTLVWPSPLPGGMSAKRGVAQAAPTVRASAPISAACQRMPKTPATRLANMVTRPPGPGKSPRLHGCKADAKWLVWLSVHRLGRQNFDAEAGEAHIGAFGRGEQPDRRDAEVAQDLRPEPDL